MVDQNSELSGAGEGAEDLELEPKLPKGDEGQGGDPLDDIKDPVAQAEAKKHRAIMRRQEKEGKSTPDPVTPPASQSEFLTKQDFYKSNERKAIRAAVADPAVKAAWNEILPFYAPRHGKETPEDILEDINDAVLLYKARHPEVKTDDSARVLSATPVVKAGSGESGKAPSAPVNPPNFHLPVQPKDWYAKK